MITKLKCQEAVGLIKSTGFFVKLNQHLSRTKKKIYKSLCSSLLICQAIALLFKANLVPAHPNTNPALLNDLNTKSVYPPRCWNLNPLLRKSRFSSKAFMSSAVWLSLKSHVLELYCLLHNGEKSLQHVRPFS